MNEINKFLISLLVFSMVFPLILYFKINKLYAVIAFFILLIITMISLINKKFAGFLKIKLNKSAKFIANALSIMALFIVYVFTIIPIKILNLIFKRDRLSLNKKEQTYWINVKEEENNWDLQY